MPGGGGGLDNRRCGRGYRRRGGRAGRVTRAAGRSWKPAAAALESGDGNLLRPERGRVRNVTITTVCIYPRSFRVVAMLAACGAAGTLSTGCEREEPVRAY